MADNPINQIVNSGVSPVQPTPSYGPDKPALGAGEEANERPFSFGPEGNGGKTQEASSGFPSPMQVAGDAAKQQQQVIEPEQLSNQISQLHDQLNTIKAKLSNPNITQNFSGDHYNALQKVTDKINPDLHTIGKYANKEYLPPQHEKGEPLLHYIVNWVNGSQSTLKGALEYLQQDHKPNPAAYLRLQYAVQRATQRGELFASIVGSSVSGIKTLMSTQLG